MGNSPTSFRTGVGGYQSLNVSNVPLWGRAWKLTVKTQSADQTAESVEILTQNSWDPEALRVTFDVVESANYAPFWSADVRVYNLNIPEVQNLLWNAVWLTLEAGYQNGDNMYSTIWDGPVIQVIFDRENVVDLVTRFNCISTLPFLEQQLVSFQRGPGYSQYGFVSDYIENNLGGTPGQNISPYAATALKGKQYIRGKTFFGSGHEYVGQIAEDNFLSHWNSGGVPNVSEIANPNAVPPVAITYGPPYPPGAKLPANATGQPITRSVIGVPKQSPFGCEFTVLLDPRLKVTVPPMAVKLDNTLISQAKLQPQVGSGSSNLPTILDQSGVFIVGQVRHYGDTRGNAWYTEVNGWSTNWAQRLSFTPLATAFAQRGG